MLSCNRHEDLQDRSNSPHDSGDELQDQSRPLGNAEEELLEEKDAAASTIEQQLAVKEKEFEEMQQRYLRLAADFENFRRRKQKEAMEIRRTANECLLQDLLPIIDNFERALEAARQQMPENIIIGIEMIYRQLCDLLSREGVQPVESVGKPFNIHYQDAFEQVETTEFPDGTVIEEIQKGYLLQDKVLRPALVKVAKNPASKDNSNASEEEVCTDE